MSINIQEIQLFVQLRTCTCTHFELLCSLCKISNDPQDCFILPLFSAVYPTSYKSAHPVHLITSPTTVPSPISFPSYHPSIPGAATYNSHIAAAAQMQQQFLAQQQMMAAVVSQHHQHQSSVQQQQRVGGDRTLDQMPNTKPGSKQGV